MANAEDDDRVGTSGDQFDWFRSVLTESREHFENTPEADRPSWYERYQSNPTDR